LDYLAAVKTWLCGAGAVVALLPWSDTVHITVLI
jgi:hypothetical protein